MMLNFKQQQQGLTLIELVIVFVVIGIVSGTAAMKYSASSSFTISQQSQRFANHLRQMQAMAVNWGCNLKMVVNTNSYSVMAKDDYTGTDKALLCGDGVTVVNNPGSFDGFNYSLEHGVIFSLTGTLYLDEVGRPIDVVASQLSINTDFQMTEAVNNWRIRIIPVTGFVIVTKL